METLRFLTPEIARELREDFGTPIYVYDLATLRRSAEAALAFPNAYGLTVRYAMKAAPNAAILKFFSGLGLHIDASSGFEAWRALKAGIPAAHICLSSQEFPGDFAELHEAGIQFNACSLNQLENFGRLFPGGACGVRLNPGLGSGGTGKTNVGGPHASFGIWHEWLPQIKDIVERYELTVERIHTHIGSGSDPEVWAKVSGMSVALVKEFPDVHTLDLGGGFKVGRMASEVSTDLQSVGAPVKEAFEKLFEETGRKIKLEIEPGTFLVANSAALLCTAQDVISTGGPDGMNFIKLDAGMTEILRPSLYAAQHPIVVIPEEDDEKQKEESRKRNEEETQAINTGDSSVNTSSFISHLSSLTQQYLVVGHCCESGDILTPSPDDPEGLLPRELATAHPGDLVVIEGAGAYCSAMSAKNYNSFPEAAEVLLDESGAGHLIRQRQTLEQILQNEVEWKDAESE